MKAVGILFALALAASMISAADLTVSYTLLAPDTYRVAASAGDVACGASSSLDWTYQNAKLILVQSSSSALGGSFDLTTGSYTFSSVLYDPVGKTSNGDSLNGIYSPPADRTLWKPRVFWKVPGRDCYNWNFVAYNTGPGVGANVDGLQTTIALYSLGTFNPGVTATPCSGYTNISIGQTMAAGNYRVRLADVSVPNANGARSAILDILDANDVIIGMEQVAPDSTYVFYTGTGQNLALSICKTGFTAGSASAQGWAMIKANFTTLPATNLCPREAGTATLMVGQTRDSGTFKMKLDGLVYSDTRMLYPASVSVKDANDATLASGIIIYPGSSYTYNQSGTSNSFKMEVCQTAAGATTAKWAKVKATVLNNPMTYWLYVAVSPIDGGLVTGAAGGLATGTTRSIGATPNAGYAFANWSVSSGNCAIANPGQASTYVTMGAGNCYVMANFRQAGQTLPDYMASGGGLSQYQLNQTYSYTVGTYNIGNGAAATSTTKLYVEGRVQSFSVPALATNGSWEATATIYCTAPGQFNISVVADANNNIAESNENNNFLWQAANCVAPTPVCNSTVPICGAGTALSTYTDAAGCPAYKCVSVCPDVVAPICSKGSSVIAYTDSNGCTAYTCSKTLLPIDTVSSMADASGDMYAKLMNILGVYVQGAKQQ